MSSNLNRYDKKYTSNFIFELMIILLTYPVLSIKYISNKKETGGVINDNVFFVLFQEAYSRMNLCILSSCRRRQLNINNVVHLAFFNLINLLISRRPPSCSR